MKKIILLVTMLTFLLVAHAQEVDSIANYHMEFKGVPIDGTLSSFIQKLQSKGFKKLQDDIDDDIKIMEGNFAGEQSTLYILASPKSKTVWKVLVQYPKENSWSSLKYKYKDIKNLYIKKYGEPKDHFEFFSKPYYEGDGYELQALKNDKCTYATYFKLKEGYISVAISSPGCIEISYEDSLNNALKNKEKDSDILNDI